VKSLLAVLLVVGAAPALADEPAETSCSVITLESNGAPKTTPMDKLKVIEQTARDGAFALPRGAPKGVQAVMCKRSSILPAAHDYKVLQSGYMLYVSDELGRVAVLGMADGRVQLDMLDGAMTEAERTQVGLRLREFEAALKTSP
jgi:hypothetical protein